MRAIRCNGPQGVSGLRLENVPEPDPGTDEVLVDVEACGVNFPDLLICQGRYHERPAPPFTLGGEFSGKIVAIGSGVEALQPGDRVAGFTTTGAFADRIAVPASKVHKIHNGISFEVAAGFALNYTTASAGLNSLANIRPGEALLVLGGSGGIGLAAVDIGCTLGASVIACASSENKLDVCRQYSISGTINYSRENIKYAARCLTGGKGIDVVIDPVGGDYSEAAFRSLRWSGRHVVLGFASGIIPKLPLNLPLLKGAWVVGMSVGEFAERESLAYAENWQMIQSWLAAGRLRPHIGEVFPLAEVPWALTLLETRQAVGKLVVSTGR